MGTNSKTIGVCPNCGAIIHSWNTEMSDMLACAGCGWAQQVVSPAYKEAPLAVITTDVIDSWDVLVGGTAKEISVVATGSGTLSYRWMSNTTPVVAGASAVSGATNAAYSPPRSLAGTVYYFCEITNTDGHDTAIIESSICAFTVVAVATDPVFTTDVEATAGSDVDDEDPTPLFVVCTATGALSYQWMSNSSASVTGGTAIEGETDSTYQPPVDTEGEFFYYCEVTNTVMTSTKMKKSAVCTYTVLAPVE